MFMKCLLINEEVHTPKLRELANLYDKFGDIFEKNILSGKAEELFTKCLRIREEVLPNHHSLTRICLRVGRILYSKHWYEESKECS